MIAATITLCCCKSQPLTVTDEYSEIELTKADGSILYPNSSGEENKGRQSSEHITRYNCRKNER